MTMLLAGDIGGTKTILRLVNSQASVNENHLPQQTTLYEQVYPSQEFCDLVPIIRHFFEEASHILNKTLTVKNACFGIAGPVVNNASELTNLHWLLTGTRLEQELFLEKVTLINDFSAIGYGILGLREDDLYTLQDVQPNPQSPIAVLGAGTGLGEGFLLPFPNGSYGIFASEGSHADFAPRTSLEFELMTYIQKNSQISRVSVERVVSGPGIVSIYQFLRDRYPDQETDIMKQIYKVWQEENIDLAAEVSQAALKDKDILCEQTMKIFIEAYGAEAGNLSLKLLPYGGLYIAGGIAAKILPLMLQGDFLKSFRDKGRLGSLLANIPFHIILNPQVGLIGAGLKAAH
ncbi:glucokinase [Aphanothece sacrum]|uniref:Glucokinase n=1 Tax=Aphanothece sacrum FPU1 TaxID=1920663 RepID=A0A401IG81_APHSA|nr:glucokinase [Aphanothece sacrum]GBF80224.1 glucokinase [Aphanothece sacrum FPU1]GBF85377.1 glucokinase [Aphanothece sacrum FPU3]